jgi:hypothetical protein
MARKKQRARAKHHRGPSLGKTNKVRAPVRQRLTLPLIVVVLIVAPLVGYILITHTTPSSASYISGIDILSDCDSDISGRLSMTPRFDDGTIEAILSIDDAKEIIPRCRSLTFVLPSMTANHHFMLPTLHDGKPIDPDQQRRIQNAKRPLSDITHSDLGNDIVKVDLSKVPEFTGNVAFTWLDGLQRLSYSDWHLRVPFGALKTSGDSRKGLQTFHVVFPALQEYRLKSKSIEPSSEKALQDSSFYWFDLTPEKSVLDLVFEDGELATRRDRIKDMCLVALGVGAAVFLGEYLAYKRKSMTHN